MPKSPPLYPVGEAPCDHCKLAQHCRMHLAACQAYSLYLNGSNPLRWRIASREPQREIYESLLIRHLTPKQGGARVRRQRAPEATELTGSA